MKQLFFLTLLINIAFFLWQYKTGAFKPKANEQHVLEKKTKQILLLSETKTVEKVTPLDIATVKKQRELLKNKVDALENKFSELKTKLNSVEPEKKDTTPVVTAENAMTKKADSDNKINPPQKEETKQTTSVEKVVSQPTESSQNKPAPKAPQTEVSATQTTTQCYQASPFYNREKINRWLRALNLSEKSISIEETKKGIVSAWIVYYPAEKTFEASEKNLQRFKQLGVQDMWLFTEGEKSGEISLGMFKNKNSAIKTQQQFIAKSIAAKIKPRYKSPPTLVVNLQTNKAEEQLKTTLSKISSKTSLKLQKCRAN